MRLLTTNALIAYIASWVLYLSGASEDPRMLLPAWVSIATVGRQLTGEWTLDGDSLMPPVDTDGILPPFPT